MFELSKILGPALDPRTVLFVILLAGTVLLWTSARRLGRWLVSVAVATALVFVLLPIGPNMLYRLEHRFPRPPLPATIDGIIALGGDFNVTLAEEYGPSSAASPRLMALADLSRKYPQARLVFSGGSGRLTPHTAEAELAPRIVAALGVDPSRVLYEGASRNTRENALLSRAAVAPQRGETWILITAASHMPRAIGVFRTVEWPVVPYPVEFQAISGARPFSMDGGLRDLAIATRESVGLIYYWLRGWTDAPFPAP
ncbi:MAG: YdcF family protein [Alphaproteobacteria bacterium]|nr:YdcF family protein [Alphaproteobacteria bacterium]